MPPQSRRQFSESKSPALNRFVNRIKWLKLLEMAISSHPPYNRPILKFHGMSGQGKSLLIRKFLQVLKTEDRFANVRYSLVDLSERSDRESWRLPVWIRNDFANQGVRFPAFDIGFELYWSEAFPESPPPVLTHRWLKRLTSSTAAGAGDLATTIAAEGLQHLIASVPFVGLAVNRLGKIGLEWGTQKYLIATNDALKELFKDGTLKSAAEVETLLPFLLESDLNAFRRRDPDTRFAVFIDEYERCLEQGGAPIFFASILSTRWSATSSLSSVEPFLSLVGESHCARRDRR